MSVPRFALLTGLTIVCLGLAWSVIANTAAYNLADANPAAALMWVGNQPSALDQFAEQELNKEKDGDLGAARQAARRALRGAPLDEKALAVLGLIAERQGDQQGAETLMRLAGARTWRDRGVQAWLFNHDVRQHNYAQALPHADAILRAQPALQPQLMPVLAALTVDPRAFAALTAFLATEPPWRTWLLSELSGRLSNRARVTELYDALKATPAPPTKDELLPYLTRLIGDGRFGLARAVWRETLPEALRQRDALLFNGDFSLPTDRMPFNWVLTTAEGADIAVVPSPTDENRKVLQVQFSGGRVNFANANQLLMLAPGTYSFAGAVRAEALDSPRGLWWRVFCADGNKASLGQTELVTGTIAWTDFSLDFQVPNNGCAAQWVQLELPARIASERRIAGEVWYRNLRVTRGSTGAPPAEQDLKSGKRS